MIVDAHVHLPVYEGLQTLQQKKARLLADMERDGIDACVVISDSELDSAIGSMEQCVQLFAEEPNIHVVCGISPLIDYEAQLNRLRRFLSAGKAAGIKLFPGHEGFYLSDARLAPVLELAQAFSVPVLFHSGWVQAFYADAQEARSVLTAHPALTLVCSHCFYPDLRACLDLKDFSNLMYDLSSVADDPAIAQKLVPDIQALIDRCPDRVMFGSDYASCERQPHLDLMRQLRMDAATAEKVMGLNARRVYWKG